MILNASYWDYFRPMVLPFLLLYMSGIVSLVLSIRKLLLAQNGQIWNQLIFSCVFMIGVILISWNMLPRMIRLLCDIGSESQYTQGFVTEIRSDVYSARYSYNDHPCRASYVVLNEEEYYIMSSDHLYIGAQVELYYLPQSNIVLKCSEIKEPTHAE